MKTILQLITVAAMFVMADSAQAQIPNADGEEKKDEAPAQQRGQRGGGIFGGGNQSNPLLKVLDADKDGDLSKEEIANASTALLTLDKDKDEKLSAEEMRPPTMGEMFTERIKGYDKDGDGKITKEEFPEQMRRMVDRLDTDKDGAVDEKELAAMQQRFAAWGGRGRGGDRGGGDRAGGQRGGDRAGGQRGGDRGERGGDKAKNPADPNI